MINFLNFILDKSIFFSFDRSGYLRHKKKFTENIYETKIKDKSALITGGTAGIGYAVADTLSKLDGEVTITGRDENKGKKFSEMHTKGTFKKLDIANWEDVIEFCKTTKCYDFVVLNAGSMPETYLENKFCIEFQCASQLIGHYLLISELKKYGKLKKNTRIVWISSGGMYLKKLDLDNLFQNKSYDKISTYANVKRAQVTLVEELSKENKWDDCSIFSMHPGWVATHGVRDALPTFNQLMKNRLRHPDEGADTILWLLLTKKQLKPGGFYFDRNNVSAYISNRYNPSALERSQLCQKIDNILQLTLKEYTLSKTTVLEK